MFRAFFYRLLMYCCWRFIYQEGKVGISLTDLTPPHLCPVPIQNLDFQRYMSWSFLCSVKKGNNKITEHRAIFQRERQNS